MNNFNISSNGENVELNVFYDTDAAQFYFDDFVSGADGETVEFFNFGRDSNLYLIGDSSAPMYKKSQLAKMKKSELIDLVEKYEGNYCYDFSDSNKSYLVNELLGVTIKRHYEYLTSA
jgi:hypothetical protein